MPLHSVGGRLVMLPCVCRRLSLSVTLHGGLVSFRPVRATPCYWVFSLLSFSSVSFFHIDDLVIPLRHRYRLRLLAESGGIIEFITAQIKFILGNRCRSTSDRRRLNLELRRTLIALSLRCRRLHNRSHDPVLLVCCGCCCHGYSHVHCCICPSRVRLLH